ncbi:MAG: MurR/RpiR family transcriptional regulator [Eubacteriales bacterium]|nr:MurR/RpiR family transcriptional regulator [Eubacteriales bacterium]
MSITPKLNCRDLIRQKFQDLNKREKLVAAFILQYPNETIHMTIAEVAKASGVSDTTVFRLTRSLGYKGFYEFKIALASSVVEPLRNVHNDIESEDSRSTVMSKLSHGYTLSLKESIERNSDLAFSTVVNKLAKAKTVYFFGSGGSHALALDAYHKFVRNGIQGQVTADPHWMSMYVALAEAGDLLFLISLSGRNKDLMHVASEAKAKGLDVAVISSSAASPLALVADVLLLAAGREYEYRSEAMEARISTLLLIDTLYIMLAKLNKAKEAESLANIKAIREHIAEHREFEED